MQILNKFLLEQTILFALVYCLNCTPMWSYDVTNVYVENLAPDVIICDLYKTTIRRGVYAFSGTIDIKQDLSDDFRIETEMSLSQTGSNDSYSKSAIYCNNFTLSDFGYKIYEPYLLDELSKCTENIWLYVDEKLEPLTKRLMSFNNCVFNTEKMPSYMTPGYYRITSRYRNQAEGSIIFEVNIYNE